MKRRQRIESVLPVLDPQRDSDAMLANHKAKWEQLGRENDRYYVRSVDHEQSDEDYEESGRENVVAFVDNDPIIRSRLHPFSDKTVLEIGCGSGRMTKTFARMFGHVIGIDISHIMLEKAEKFADSSNAKFVESDGASVPVPRNSIDLAFSYIVYQHFPSREAVQTSFNGVWSALRVGGLFKVQLRGARHPDPNRWSWGPHYSQMDAKELIRQCAFRMLSSDGAGNRIYWLLLEKVDG